MCLILAWPSSEAPRQIFSGEIHVWAWPLESRKADVTADTALLDTSELNRFHRFHFDGDRSRFAVAHANMRRILGAYLKQPPNRIGFRANRFGKPELADESTSQTLCFNLSHSRSLALLALSPDIEVGVDVEELRSVELEVPGQSFSPVELSALESLQGEEWLYGFYRCWTRKEAILKAEGVGLNFPLDAFDVSLLPGEPAELLQARAAANFSRPWKLQDLCPATGIVAALAAGSPNATIACFSLEL